MFDAYSRIFARCELDNSPVQADSGAMSGSASAEFMVKSEVGEDEIVFCSGCDYAANIEKATSCLLYTSEIAQKLGISRPTVSKLLKEAKERGYLRIEIVGPQEQNCYKLERELEEKFGLKEAIVVEDKHDDIFQKEELGAEVAKYLYRIIQEGDIIGVSMGTTLKMIPQYALSLIHICNYK